MSNNIAYGSHFSYLSACARDFELEYLMSPETPADFLEEFVPSGKRYPFSKREFTLFGDVPTDEGDSGLCGPLVQALSDMVAPFPRDQRPTFSIAASRMFRPLSESEQPTLASIIIRLPQSNTTTFQDDGWLTAACSIEVKGQAQQDPFQEDGEVKRGISHIETIAQLAQAGRNILAGHSSCFSFVLGVYGHNARIFRFDRAGVIVSRAFNYVAFPDILTKFLWRFVHPHDSAGVVGSDSTLSRPTRRETSEMLDLIRQHHPEIPEDEVVRHARWIRASLLSPSDTPSSARACTSVRCFTVGAPLSAPTGLFCRGTVVWRVLVEGQGHRLYALKDYWQEECFQREVDLYEWIGLARFQGSLNLGTTEPDDSGHATRLVTSRGHKRMHLRSLTYPLCRKLPEFASDNKKEEDADSAASNSKRKENSDPATPNAKRKADVDSAPQDKWKVDGGFVWNCKNPRRITVLSPGCTLPTIKHTLQVASSRREGKM